MREQTVYVFGGDDQSFRHPEVEVQYLEGRGVLLTSGDSKVYLHYSEVQQFAALMDQFAVQAMADKLREEQMVREKMIEESKWQRQTKGSRIQEAISNQAAIVQALK